MQEIIVFVCVNEIIVFIVTLFIVWVVVTEQTHSKIFDNFLS